MIRKLPKKRGSKGCGSILDVVCSKIAENFDKKEGVR